MDCKTTSTRPRAARGFTLIELMVASIIGVMVVIVLVMMLFYTSRSFAAIFNYVDLDQYSRKALDRMSMEIRQADRLVSSSTNHLAFSYNGGTLTYTYSPQNRTLVRTWGSQRETLLTECDSLQFSIFQRNPIGGTYDVYPTGVPDTTKLVQLAWVCSRKILGQRVNTESVQSAKFVLRKQ